MAYYYPQATGYVAPPTAAYYYAPAPSVPMVAPGVGAPAYVQFVQNHPQPQALAASATNIQRMWRGKTERVAQHMEPPKGGTIVVQVNSASNLHNAQCCCAQSPYAVVTYGKGAHRTRPHSSGGQYPDFAEGGDAVACFEFDPEVEHVRVDLWNANWFCDDKLGFVVIPVDELWRSVTKEARPTEYHMEGKSSRGVITLTAFYVPPLHVTIHRCRDLLDVQAVGKQDPFVVVTVPGAFGRQQQRTAVCRDGHKDPKWETATHTFLLRHQWHLQRPPADEKKADDADRPQGPGMTFQVVNENAVKNANIAYTRVPWELTLKTWLRGPVWTQLLKGTPKTKKEVPAGFIAWSVSGGPAVRDDEERAQSAHPPEHYGMQQMPAQQPQYQQQQHQGQQSQHLMQSVPQSSSQQYS